MTISLEHITPEDWPAVDRMRQALQGLVLDTGGQSVGIRMGTQSFIWPGGVGQQTFTISHGLGKAPVIVLAVNSSNNTRGMPRTYTYTTTTFVLDVLTSDASVPAATTSDVFRWVAIG